MSPPPTEHPVIYTTIVLQYSAVLLGMTWGWAARAYPIQVPTWWAVPAMLSVVMLGIASFQSKCTESTRSDVKASRLLIALTAYEAIVVGSDPFVMAGDGR